MPAYLISIREGAIRDPAEMERYTETAKPSGAGFNVKPLVIYGRTEALELKAPEAIVILEFPTFDEAKAWYDSPAYQAAVPHRKKAADFRVMIVEGL